MPWQTSEVSLDGKRGPGRPPAARSADTRDRIIRAAGEVFTELGYGAATFQAIAERSDLTRPAINHYFSSKKVLYNAVLDRTNALVLAAGADRARAETSLAGRLRTFVEAALKANSENESAIGFLATAVLDAQRHPGLQRDNNPLEMLRQFLAWAVAEAVGAGELSADADAEALVELLVSMLWGLGFYAGFVGGQEDLVRITAQLQLLLEQRLWAGRG